MLGVLMVAYVCVRSAVYIGGAPSSFPTALNNFSSLTALYVAFGIRIVSPLMAHSGDVKVAAH